MREIVLAACISILCAPCAFAWDGFDADTGDLVELPLDSDPDPGDKITLNNKDTDNIQEAIVESVKRNRKTIEVVVRLQNGEARTLVMEGR